MASKRERRIEMHAYTVACREFGMKRWDAHFTLGYCGVTPHFNGFSAEMHDIIRAAKFASILAAATGDPVAAVAIGDGVSERDRRIAERCGVRVSLLWSTEERDAERRRLRKLRDATPGTENAAARLDPPSGDL